MWGRICFKENVRMIIISKNEAKMIRKMFPHVHMVTTVNKVMVDELPEVLKALPNNEYAKQALKELNGWNRERVYNTRESAAEGV